jgi:site-specific DNA-methyltransferase (adenine-specific)
MTTRRTTTTSAFGAGGREAHDATPFYRRFHAPVLSDDETVLAPTAVPEPFVCGDARRMDQVADNSVALVVTSPPYFAGKQYELEVERDGIPSTFLEYLDLLRAVFAECVRKLEPGGRMAVNVANLGRRPYRSLSADVIRILGDDLGLLLRGELIWRKAEGATGSCAWGSYRRAANPVLRDLTERVIVASKGRFDRARSPRRRAAEGLPHESTVTGDEFLASTLDVWSLPPESATRVGHPAPFPVELPERLIQLYTYRRDLVLDPFMGSGSTLVAAARSDRRYVGYDLDPGYVALARRRVAEALAAPGPDPESRRYLAERDGDTATTLAERTLTEAGFSVVGRSRRLRGTGVAVDIVGRDADGADWFFDVVGPFTRQGGMLRTEEVWRALGRAAALSSARGATPLVVVTTQPPPRPGPGDAALRAAGPGVVFDVVDVLDDDGFERLQRYAKGAMTSTPLFGFWTARDLGRGPAGRA